MKRPIQPRRQLLINRPYQFRFIAEILAAALLATLLSATATYIITKREVGRITAEGRGGPAGLEEILPGIIVASALVTLASMALLGAYVTLWETHRVVGPVKRMEMKLQEMTEGDFRYMESFRKGDVLKGLDDSINIHLNNLSDFFRVFEAARKEIIPRLAAIERGEGDTRQLLEVVRRRIAEIDHYADVFRPN